ncbi:unnamed protein product [Ostreobium quekettii]|uniref:Uncharacterized protein n=1 Tax=Ostreobium quekettii TaxID=121088 RepID=A0A8S1JCE1_9CHLO|nr:unnamed protein product [Ostreobium quekettii]
MDISHRPAIHVREVPAGSIPGGSSELCVWLFVHLQEEVRDLLAMNTSHRPSIHRPSIHVGDVPGGGGCLFGATETEVWSKADTAALLEQGILDSLLQQICLSV